MIVTGIVIYLLVGLVLLTYAAQDAWGALLLHIWWFVLLFWPLLLLYSTAEQIRSRPRRRRKYK